jgi:hypothetical protein
VHIEHTVPVNVLVKALKFHVRELRSPEAVHKYLIDHSICTALHFDEKRMLGDAGVDSKRSPAFNDEGLKIGDHPFRRYRKIASVDNHFRIFNVVSGCEINIDEFTFGDHLRMLEAASAMVLPHGNEGTLYSLKRFTLVD